MYFYFCFFKFSKFFFNLRELFDKSYKFLKNQNYNNIYLYEKPV